MPRTRERALSPTGVKTIGVGMHADGGCLYLCVTRRKGGGLNRSWVFRYGVMVDGRTRYRDHGLGPLSVLSLSEAREKARLLRQQRHDGIDPIEQRKAARALVPVKVVTFDQVSDQWLDTKRPEWGDKYARQQTARLRDYASPIIGPMDVRAIEVANVIAVLDPVWSKHPNSAGLIRMSLEQILDFAKVRGLREGENPARWAGHLKHALGKPTKLRKARRAEEGREQHHAALPYREIGGFMGELRALGDDVTAWAFEFTVLTAVRTGEAVFSLWSEVDLDARAWTVPAGRMKAGKQHKVPLSPAAIDVLRRASAVRTGDDRVFPGVGESALLGLLKRRLGRTVTVHGFRSTFRDWAGETTNIPREVCEAALAHYAGGTEAAYARGDLFEKRRRLMDAWGAYCDRPATTATVLPLNAARKKT